MLAILVSRRLGLVPAPPMLAFRVQVVADERGGASVERLVSGDGDFSASGVPRLPEENDHGPKYPLSMVPRWTCEHRDVCRLLACSGGLPV